MSEISKCGCARTGGAWGRCFLGWQGVQLCPFRLLIVWKCTNWCWCANWQSFHITIARPYEASSMTRDTYSCCHHIVCWIWDGFVRCVPLGFCSYFKDHSLAYFCRWLGNVKEDCPTISPVGLITSASSRSLVRRDSIKFRVYRELS